MTETKPLTGWASLRMLNRYQWFVFIICCLAWDLDCLDQQLFVLARNPAVSALVSLDPAIIELKATDPIAAANIVKEKVNYWGAMTTAVFMIGWAIGGLGFGVLGDRLGRVKTLTATIALYAIFTGLSALSTGLTDFMLYRFLTGLGVGGCFAAAVVLLAETVPEAPRPYILGMFQASSVLGNCTAALIGLYLGSMEKDGAFPPGTWLTPWRIMFLIGIIPGFLLAIVQFTLREPDKWLALREAQLKGERESPFKIFFGTMGGMLTTPPWNKRALFGLLLTSAGVIGLWGIGFFATDLVKFALETSFKDAGLQGAELNGEITRWRGITSLFQNAGAFLGIFAFSWVTGLMGRRPTFAIFFLLGGAATAFTFWNLRTVNDVYWMIPLMGFFQLAVFGGFAIYLPELFPTRYRSTGTSFCYNAGRLLAAAGPFALGILTSDVFGDRGPQEALRYAGVCMCSVFVIGIFALPFLPETKGKPLPE